MNNRIADLTIIMPTYNKEDYIADALDSIFMQETHFTYQILVADDCSTDNTLKIVKMYQKKYPGQIKILTSDKNQKLYKNVIRAYKITNSKYWCVLDPDDYWFGTHKIENALNFLEQNPEYTIYASDIEILEQDGSRHNCCFSKKAKDSDWHDYLNGNAVISFTNGTIFRNVALGDKLPQKLLDGCSPTQTRSFRGDTFRNALQIHHGKAHYEPVIEAVYRITESGIWAGSDIITRNIINCLVFRDLWLFFDKKYPELLLRSRTIYRNSIAKNFLGALQDINTERLAGICSDIIDLEKTYAENAAILDAVARKKMSLKNKVRLMLYKKLQKKLTDKGVL